MDSRLPNRRRFLEWTGMAVAGACTPWELLGCREARKHEAKTPAAESNSSPHADPNVGQWLRAPVGMFRPTQDGCTLHWVTRGTVQARVMAKPENASERIVDIIHCDGATEFPLAGFAPNQVVGWRCEFRTSETDDWRAGEAGEVQTGRSPGEPYRVALMADSHLYACMNKPQRLENLKRTITRVIRDGPDFVIFLGDEAGVHYVADRARDRDQSLAYERWETWRNVLAPLLAARPSFMVLGNHEGEAGFDQKNMEYAKPSYLQRWGTIARKRYYLNPLPTTYAEGGEDEGWQGSENDPSTGGAAEGNGSPLQNYYAWTWGDALFVVLDVHRYTRVGQATPDDPRQWTLGDAQMSWLERTLANSGARWKFVIAHHVVGGSNWDLKGMQQSPPYVYGRGGARYARVGEQSRITDLMIRHGAQFFLYGHDHVFAHQQAEGIHYVCCGRPTYLQPAWWPTPGWREAYGETAKRDPYDVHAALGYTMLDISSSEVNLRYIRTAADPAGAENVDTPIGKNVYSFGLQS